MVIIFYVDSNAGGYGDFLFALKVIQSLRHYLFTFTQNATIEAMPEFYLVTDEKGKAKVQHLKGDVEFQVPVLSVSEYLQVQDNFKVISLLIGPSFSLHENFPLDTCELLNIPAKTPILVLPEYSGTLEPIHTLKGNDKYPQIDVLPSGMGIREQGILISPELLEVRKQTLKNDFSYRERYWRELSRQWLTLLAEGSATTYHDSHSLFLEYTSTNNFSHFLNLQLAYEKDASKHHDLVSIGPHLGTKLNIMFNMIPILREKGFNKIVFMNVDSGFSSVLYESESALKPKVFRLFHANHISHREMIAFIVLCDFARITGDQSFSEAFSAGKLLSYEWLTHKIGFILASSYHFNEQLQPLIQLLFLLKELPISDKNVDMAALMEMEELNSYQKILNTMSLEETVRCWDLMSKSNETAESTPTARNAVEMTRLLTIITEKLEGTGVDAGQLIGFNCIRAQMPENVRIPRPEHYLRFAELVNDPVIIQKYHQICGDLLSKYDLAANIGVRILMHILSTKSSEIKPYEEYTFKISNTIQQPYKNLYLKHNESISGFKYHDSIKNSLSLFKVKKIKTDSLESIKKQDLTFGRL